MNSVNFLPVIHWHITPTIFPNFHYLRWYGLLWAIGLVSAYLILKHTFNRDKQPIELVDRLSTYLILGIIIGARLGHVFFYDWAYFKNHLLEAILPFSFNPFRFTGYLGLASHGGVIGCLVALAIFNFKHRQGYIWLLDRMVIGAAILGGFIRLGNLMNSEIIGTETDLPWGFIFHQIDQTPRHPAQLYESIFYFIVFGITYTLWKRMRSKYNGLIIGVGLILIFAFRFLVEYIKIDQSAFEASMMLNMGQWLSIPFIVLGVFFVVTSKSKPI